MQNKILLGVMIFLLSLNSLSAEDYCEEVSLNTVIGSVNTLNDSTDLSTSLLFSSKNMLTLSKSILMTGSTMNTEYVKAMLQLSQDIGEMANRIGEMADRILVMADNIGEMSDRIIETQRIQSNNVALTQRNLLKAERNFNFWLLKN
jgi:hypothetical protein